MRLSVVALRLPPLLALVLVAGCGVGNWFSRSPPETLEPAGGFAPETADPRPLIADVTALRLEPTPYGVILHAEAMPPTPGWWDTDLVPAGNGEGGAGGTLVYEFRGRPPLAPQPGSNAAARRVEAAAFIPNRRLDGVGRITVAGAGGSRSLRR